MQQGAGKNIPFDYPFVWGWKQNFRVTINHKNDNGSIRSEPLLTNIKFIIYNNKTALQIKRSFQLTGNEGITFDNNAGTVTINIDHNTPEILPVGQYFYMIEYHRTGLGIEQVYSGSFFVSVDGDCNCDILDYVSQSIEIAHVNGLRAELDDKVYGTLVRNRGFRLSETNDYAITATYIFVDHLNGTDGLNPIAYYDATIGGAPIAETPSTPPSGYKFKTLQAACHWVNRSEEQYVVIQIFNTTSLDRHTLTADAVIKGKTNVSIIGETFASKAFLNLSTFRIIGANSRLSLGRLDITFTNSDPIISTDNGIVEIAASSITYPATAGYGLFWPSNGVFHIGDRVTINFSANDQILFNPKGNYGGKCVVTTHVLGVPVFNVGVFTGLKWSALQRSFETFFSDGIILSIPSSLSMANSICYYNQNAAYGVSSFDTLSYNYPLNLGTTKPIRTPDMTSNSPNGAYTTRKAVYVNEFGEFIVG